MAGWVLTHPPSPLPWKLNGDSAVPVGLFAWLGAHLRHPALLLLLLLLLLRITGWYLAVV